MKRPAAFRPFRFALLALLAAGAGARADNWPHWRGPGYDGISREKGLPTEWGADHNIAWKAPLPGMAGSTPVVWGQRIFLTSEEGKDLVLLCVGTDGKPRWKRLLGTGNRRVMGGEGNGASASPSTDGKHVYAFVSTGDLACYDFEGREVWKFNVQDRYGRFRIQFGMHSTPLLYGGRLYLQLLHSGGYWVVALDKATGKEVWKVKRPSDARYECEHSYASPCLGRRGREAYLITHGNDYAVGHRLADGGEIWRLADLNGPARYHPTLRFIASPVAVADLVVVPTAKNGPVVGLDPRAKGTVKTGGKYELWRRPKGTPDVPSPLVAGGLVYLCRESGELTCLDARTGKPHYSKVIHAYRHRASPVYADGKVYLTARDGTVTVVRAGPGLKVVATNRLPDQISASPVIADGRIYLRGFKALYAVEAKGGKGEGAQQ